MKKNFKFIVIIESIYAIGQLALSVFGIVFFYLYFNNSIIGAVLPFAVVHLIYALLMPFSSFFAGKLGTKKALIIAFLFFSFAAGSLVLFGLKEAVIYFLGWMFFHTLGKLFLHPSSILIQSIYSNHQERGSLMSFKKISFVIAAILTPLVAGFVAEYFGLIGLGVMAIVAFLTALIFALKIETVKFEINPKSFLRLLKKKQMKKMIILNFFYTGQNEAWLVWPIYIFLVMGSGFHRLGLFFFATGLFSIILIYAVGKLLDVSNRQLFVKYSFLGSSVCWLSKAIFQSVGFLLVADALHKMFNKVLGISSEVVNYDFLNDGLPKISKDEAVIIREVPLDVFIALSLLIHGAIATYFGFRVSFLFAGLMAVSFLLTKQARRGREVAGE